MSQEFSDLIADYKKFRKNNPQRHYPNDLKERTIALLENGVPRQEIIDKLQVHPTTLSTWKKGKPKKMSSFSKAIVIDDDPNIKVTFVTGLKLSDLKGLLQ